MKKTQGFSLLELIIGVAIIGILAAIAIPSYSQYTLRGNRTLAKTVLSEVASRQENFFNDRKTYATVLGPTGLGYPAEPFYIGKSGTPSASTAGALYSITLDNPTAISFTVIATAQAGSQQAKDKDCNKLLLTNTGSKTAKKSDGSAGSADCWTR